MTESRVQIIATIGPESGTETVLGELIDRKMNAVRLNFSWGTYEEHSGYIDRTRAHAQKRGIRVPIIQDLSGPRVQAADGHGFDVALAAAHGGIITEKDLRDLQFGVDHAVEYVCMSYIGSGGDVNAVRDAVRSRGGNAKVIAKVERAVALEHIDDIISAADAIMIGRGDLGHDVPIETIPFVERNVIEKCNAARKPVITATQMLYSMIDAKEPTRAEVTDVAYAVLAGTDAIMLSEETARGKYPVEAVSVMERIASEAEKHFPKRDVLVL